MNAPENSIHSPHTHTPMPPTKTKKAPAKPRKMLVAHYTIGATPIYDYEPARDPDYIIYEFIERQLAKNKSPTFSQIKRHIPFVMGRRMNAEHKSPFATSDYYIEGQKRLFAIQEPGKLEALIERMVSDGVIKKLDKDVLA